ncbi:molecular chaperone [Yersinia sp. 1252 StPb PI]|uniref:fimbrial biogenesis chaperone n=1 Tax=Yersinia sp. 1252 StPb PI TaxID=3117404 RepID=UPI003B27CC47
MPFAHFSLITLLLMIFVGAPAMATSKGGVSLSQTRVVFSAEDKAQSLTVKNSGMQNYLIQSRIQNEMKNDATVPFIVTPPLFPLGAEGNQLLRILKQGEALPDDRESLFYLSVLAIPSQPEPVPEEARLSMGFQFVIKLFYRPTALKDVPQNVGCQLTFSRVGNGIRIENPTPYFITFGTLKFDHNVIDLDTAPSMIAPMGAQTYPVAGSIKHVEWQTITDAGGLSALCQHTVSPSQE